MSKNQPRFNKKAPIQNKPSTHKVKIEKGSGSQGVTLTCDTFGKKHYGKWIMGTANRFGCGKDGN